MSDETKEPDKKTSRRKTPKSRPSELSDETKDGEVVPFNLDLRTKDSDEVLHPDAQRFNFFLIDTGWHESVSQMVHKHFPKFLHHHNPKDSLFILTPEQSVEVLRKAPYDIGHDPIILVFDLYAPNCDGSRNYKGFRLSLGLIRHPDQAMARLQEFFRFLVMHRSSTQLDREIRRNLRREGFEGMIKVLRESTTEVL